MNRGHRLVYMDKGLISLKNPGFLQDPKFSRYRKKILFLSDLGKIYEKIKEDWTYGDSSYDMNMNLKEYYLSDKGVLSIVVLQGVPTEIDFVSLIPEKLEETVTEFDLPFDEKKIMMWKIDGGKIS